MKLELKLKQAAGSLRDVSVGSLGLMEEELVEGMMQVRGGCGKAGNYNMVC